MRPVLYLDIDDTLLTWANGSPAAVSASGRFLLWAMERFEVRWLTRWCPDGVMPDHLLADLSQMLGLGTDVLGRIPGCDWQDSGIKTDGIAWLEHTVLGRDFFWIEDPEGISPQDREVLEAAGYADRYLCCNITEDETALERVWETLEQRIGARQTAA